MEIKRTEYEKLVRDSERANIIGKLVSKKVYVSAEELKAILDIEIEDKEGDE
jgi:hypothetical protein